MRKERVMGNSIEYTIKGFVNRSTRVTTDLMKAMPDPVQGEYLTFTVTFDHTDPASNDFAAFEIGFRLPIYELWKRAGNAFEQHYRKGVANFLKRHGKTTRILPMRKERVMGNSIEYTIKGFVNRSTRVTTDLMKAMPDPVQGEYLTFTVTFDHTDPASNDFAAFEIGFRLPIYELWKRADRTFKENSDLVRTDVQEGLDDVKETFAKYLHLPATGLLATAANLRDDDDDRWDSATAYTAGSSTALIKLNPSAIARLGDGQRIEIYNQTSDTVIVNAVRVSYVHPFDETIAIETTADSEDNGGSAVTNFDTLNTAIETNSDAVEIYLDGSRDEAPSGTLAGLFDTSTSYYGRARLGGQTGYAAIHRMLSPIRIDASAAGASVDLNADLYRRVGEVVGWQQGGHAEAFNMAQVMSRFEYRKISSFVKDEGITLLPALESDVGRKLNKAFGFDGFILHDPNLGSQMMVVDDFATPGQIDFLNRAQWEIANPIDGGFRMFPGEIAGIWSRNTEDDGTGRPSKVYSANGLQLAAFVCRWPKGQIRLEGLTTT